MTQEEFIKVLEEKDYSYEIEGDKIIVTNYRHVDLDSLVSLPSGIEFRNNGDVDLRNLKGLPPDVLFKCDGYIDLGIVEIIPPGVKFENLDDVYLESLTGDFFSKNKCNIKGIESKRLLNLMIKKGMFI